MSWLIIIGLVIAGIVLVVAAPVAAGLGLYFDLLSTFATGCKLLSPAGKPAGRALVVYNPGGSGAAKKAAVQMAGDLQSKGYAVNLAGVKSKAAADASGYDVVIAGAPVYGSKVSSSVEAYLRAIKPQKDAALGVFGTTGWAEANKENDELFEKHVASLPFNAPNKKAAAKTIRSGYAGKADCTEFVSAVLQGWSS